MKLGTLSGCSKVNNLACLYGCHGNTLVSSPFSSNFYVIHFQRNKQQFLQFSLINIIRVVIVISLNCYNMQRFSARGLQEDICEKEEKKLGTSLLSWQPHDLPKIFIWVHPLSVPSFIEFY